MVYLSFLSFSLVCMNVFMSVCSAKNRFAFLYLSSQDLTLAALNYWFH
uniref:Uncharacterized protein n=1 Tax=Rhizophora mucronata TaxID=61149 RepID=A0A2P2NQ47_RHIMU